MNKLPADTKLDILLTLPKEELKQICTLDKELHSICNDSKFWKLKLGKEFTEFTTFEKQEFHSSLEAYIYFEDIKKLIKDFNLGNMYNPTSLYLAEELNLTNRGIKRIPPEIGALRNLVVLDLPNNQITKLPKEIKYLKNLRELELSENNLTKIPKEIGELTNLEDLGLYGNPLKDLPVEIASLKKLKRLYVGLDVNKNIQIPQQILDRNYYVFI